MIRTLYHCHRKPVVTAFLMSISLLVSSGCGDSDSLGGGAGQGQLVITMHDAPVDQFREVWLTVESVTLVRSEANAGMENEPVPMTPQRMDLLSLDSVATILAATQVSVGSYSKLRMQIADPEFVRDDDSVFTEPDIQLVANGHVDINFQQPVVLEPETITVVDLDFDLENGIQVNATGSGRYLLRPQIIVNAMPEGQMQVELDNATVTSSMPEEGLLYVACMGDYDVLLVEVGEETTITSGAGIPLDLTAISLGSRINIKGVLDSNSGVMTASAISIML